MVSPAAGFIWLRIKLIQCRYAVVGDEVYPADAFQYLPA